MRPFIFIAGFPRSGSTAMAEALTEWPCAFIHLEPRITWGGLDVRGLRLPEPWAEALRAALEAAEKRPVEDDPAVYYVREVVPRLPFAQVGIKEVSFRRFRHRIVTRETNARVVVTVRDPRDVWASLTEMGQRLDDPNWSYRGLGLQGVAERFRLILRQLGELIDGGALVVRYEELCSDPRVLRRVREFTQSPVTTGDFGRLTSHVGREWETERHPGGFDADGVGRWRASPIRHECEHFASLLGEYRERFGY